MGPERRRRWSGEEKARIVAESLAPEATASVVARRHGIHRNQLYAWRRELREETDEMAAPALAFAPVVLSEAAPPVLRNRLEVVLGAAVVRVPDDVNPDLLARVLRVLKRVG